MERYYIVRHGDTFAPGEVVRRIGKRTDIALAPSGELQAEALAAWFVERDITFAAALCGPLLRTRQTAERILARQAQPPEIGSTDWLTEIDHGPDEGAPEAAVVARIGHPALAAWDEAAVVPPGWIVDVEARIAGWRDLFDQRRAGNTLLVTSNGAARFALTAIGETSPPAGRSLKLRTGAIGVLERGLSGALRVVQWNVRPSDADR